jgi:hypothetical protein
LQTQNIKSFAKQSLLFQLEDKQNWKLDLKHFFRLKDGHVRFVFVRFDVKLP